MPVISVKFARVHFLFSVRVEPRMHDQALPCCDGNRGQKQQFVMAVLLTLLAQWLTGDPVVVKNLISEILKFILR